MFRCDVLDDLVVRRGCLLGSNVAPVLPKEEARDADSDEAGNLHGDSCPQARGEARVEHERVKGRKDRGNQTRIANAIQQSVPEAASAKEPEQKRDDSGQ